jgi:hypothetical protein
MREANMESPSNNRVTSPHKPFAVVIALLLVGPIYVVSLSAYSSSDPTGTLSISVEPALDSTLVVNGQIETLSNGAFTLSNTPYGTYNVFVENPTTQFYYKAVDLNSSELSVTVHLANPITLNSTSYPWVPLGPAYFPNPQGPDNVIQFASGHSGQLAMDESNPKIIYDASGTFVGDSGPYSAGGVYRTTDGGVTWAPTNLGLPYGDISSIYLNQSNPDQLLVGFTSSSLVLFRVAFTGGMFAEDKEKESHSQAHVRSIGSA